MHIKTILDRFPFLRNLTGAFAGAVIAVMLYGAYGIGVRVLASVIPVDTAAVRQEQRDRKIMAVGERVREILESRDRGGEKK